MNKNTKIISSIISVLVVLSLLVGYFTKLTYPESFRIFFGSIYVLFLPGFILSYAFFPKTKPLESKEENKESIDLLERIALSFALSIAIVPLAVFYLNLAGVKINILNSALTILGIIIVSLAIIYFRNKHKKSN